MITVQGTHSGQLVRVLNPGPLWPLAGFVIDSPKFKSLTTTLVNSQLDASDPTTWNFFTLFAYFDYLFPYHHHHLHHHHQFYYYHFYYLIFFVEGMEVVLISTNFCLRSQIKCFEMKCYEAEIQWNLNIANLYITNCSV